MLPRSKRLNLKKDFKWVTSGKKIETKYMKLFLKTGDPSTLQHVQGRTEQSRSATSSGPRVGIAVSSQVFKKATQRNRAKRLVSQAFQSTFYQSLDYARDKLPSTINIVALPKSSILDVKSSDVVSDLKNALKDYVKSSN